MSSPGTIRCTAVCGFISAQLALVLAVIAGGGGLLAYEWRHAHSAKTHRTGANHHHQHHAHGATPNS